MNVGSDIAQYKADQLLQKLAIPGSRITPMDQNCLKRQMQDTRYFPSVMSVTEIVEYYFKK